MTVIKNFEDIIAWQKARQLTNEIYAIFKSSRDFGFRDQIERASVSIMNNIAEGFERRSQKDFLRFLVIAKASCGEVRSLLYLAEDLRYLEQEKAKTLRNFTIDISKLLAKFISSLSLPSRNEERTE